MRGIKGLLALTIIAVMLTGCWDYVEVDRRLFVGTIGIDTSDDPDKKYAVHFTAPIVREIGGDESSSGGGGDEPPVMLISTLANSVAEAANNIDLRINRFLFLEHASTFIIGEEAARAGIEDIINPFWRNIVYNRRGHIAIAEGSAEKALEVRPRVEKLYTEYLSRLFSQERLTGKYFNCEVGDFMHQINSETTKGNALVTKLRPDEDEVDIGGAAVIKDYKLVGWLSREEIQGINLFLGSLRGGNINISHEGFPGFATFKINSAKRKLHLAEEGNVPKVLLKIFVEGEIESSSTSKSIGGDEIKQLCSATSDILKKNTLNGIEKLQKDYEVDLLRLSEYLYRFHPKAWKKYKGEWKELFPLVDIEVEVETKIRGVGVSI